MMIRHNGIGRRASGAMLASAVSLVALTCPASAQEAVAGTGLQQADGGESASTVDDIVVTATRRSESVRDVPFNIQAITADTLEKTGATDIADFARTVPGLSMTDDGPRVGVKLVLRGLRTGSEAALAPTTTVYVDEVPMDMPYRGAPLDLKLIDIERVEVLRGPQGTLFGGGAIGGTIRYISKKPDMDAIEGRIGTELSTTRHGGANYNVSGMINLPVADWIAIRANAGQFNNDGFIDNTVLGTKNVNDDRTTSSRIAVLMKPASGLDISLSYFRQTARYGESNTSWESKPRLSTDVVHPASTRYKAQLANLTLAYDLGWANFTSSSSYVDERLSTENDSTFGIRDGIFGSFLDPSDLPEFTVITRRRAKSRNFTQEARLVSSSDGPFAWIIGGYYNKMRVQEKQEELVPIPFPGQAIFEQNIIGAKLNDDKEYTYESITKTRQLAVFGELKYNFTAAWQASVGGRYFDVRGTGDFFSIDQWFGQNARDANGLARTIPLPGEFSKGLYREKGSVWRFNSSYKFGDAGLIYVTIAQGFRPGGFNLTTPNTGIPPEGRQFASDDLISYEIGGKFSLLEKRIYVSSALFRIDWSDIQTTVRTPLGFSYQGNAGKAVSQGVELEINAHDIFLRNLSFSLGYGFTDAKLTETIAGIGFKGERTPLVPRHSLSIMADYSVDIANDLKAGLNWLTSYTSGSYADFGRFKPVRDAVTGLPVPASRPNSQYLPLDGYSLTNLSLRIEGKSWSARVFVDNLFDAQFKTSRTFYTANSPYAASDVLFYANRPRTIGIGLSKTF